MPVFSEVELTTLANVSQSASSLHVATPKLRKFVSCSEKLTKLRGSHVHGHSVHSGQSAGSLLTLLPVSQLANDAEEAEAKLQAVHGFIMRFKTTNARPSEAGPPLAHKRTQKSKTAQKMRIYIRKTQLTQNITTTTTISTTANNKNDHTHSLIDSSISNYL